MQSAVGTERRSQPIGVAVGRVVNRAVFPGFRPRRGQAPDDGPAAIQLPSLGILNPGDPPAYEIVTLINVEDQVPDGPLALDGGCCAHRE
jgi:hypothetical protein